MRLRHQASPPRDDRHYAGADDLRHGALDRGVIAGGIRRHDRASPKSPDAELRQTVDPASRCGPGGHPAARIGRGLKRVPPRSETDRNRSADDRNVEALELRRVLL
jgi:hypothetical protein